MTADLSFTHKEEQVVWMRLNLLAGSNNEDVLLTAEQAHGEQGEKQHHSLPEY